MSNIKIDIDSIGVDFEQVQHMCAMNDFTLCLDDGVTITMPVDIAKQIFLDCLGTIHAHQQGIIDFHHESDCDLVARATCTCRVTDPKEPEGNTS